MGEPPDVSPDALDAVDLLAPERAVTFRSQQAVRSQAWTVALTLPGLSHQPFQYESSPRSHVASERQSLQMLC